MKKMYFLTLFAISVITAVFLFFSTDINRLNTKFLSSFKIEVLPEPISFEEIKIPEEFDDYYTEYNLMQLECGLNLLPYSGKNALRYTYKIVGFPKEYGEVFANVICIKRRPVAGDIINPSLDGFIKPLNFAESVLSEK